MTPLERTAVLLRLTPDLLDRIDRARGAMKRTAWLLDVIERRLVTVDEPRERCDANFGSVEPGSSARRVSQSDQGRVPLAAAETSERGKGSGSTRSHLTSEEGSS